MSGRFILSIDTECGDGGHYTPIDSPIEDAQGQRLSSGLPGRPLRPWEIQEGLDVRTAASGYLPVPGRGRYGDLLWYRMRGNLFLSARALSVLDRAGIRFDTELHRWPVFLINRQSRNVVALYHALWAVKRHEVLDPARSDIEYMVDGRTIRRVRRWAFDESQTPDFDVFATEALRFIVSARFREVAEDVRLSGMRFLPVG
jgi:hypothetical protein